ncbi:MAG: DUF1574 family protein [Cyanobacteria bacterium TGS_CYA1]|nr:DUF1574 family protein [Cyanobacteria bacterium TGS_CYA1]
MAPHKSKSGYFFLALALFVVANFAAVISSKSLIFSVKEDTAVFQAADSAVNQYEALKKAPDIVLLGSSLVATPLWWADRDVVPNIKDFYHHHDAVTFNQALRASGIKEDAYAFALPGAMVSDMYLIVDKIFQSRKKPEVVVLGISARDMMDDLLTGETRTPVFSRLSDLSDFKGNLDLYLSTPAEKLDFALNNLVFLYGKRYRYQLKVSQFCEKTMNKIPLLKDPKAAKTAQQAKETQPLFATGLGTRKEMWDQSRKEYQKRYEHFNKQQFDKQTVFLAKLLERAKERDIKVILVNMPLSKENKSLMPQGLYDAYYQSVSGLAQRKGASFLDLNKGDMVAEHLFLDTAHMNAQGGRKLCGELAAYLSKNSSVANSSYSM